MKQEDDAALVCYCFGVASRQIREEIRRSVVSSSAARIKAEVKEGRCACELKNPSGKCCLEEVVRAMQEALHRGGALQGGTRICRARAAWATEPAATSPATSSGRSAPRGSGPRRRSPAKIAVPPEVRLPQLSGAVESAQRTHTEESCEVSPCSIQIPTLKQELRAWERVCNTPRRHQSRPAGYLTPQQFLTELQSQPKQIQSH